MPEPPTNEEEDNEEEEDEEEEEASDSESVEAPSGEETDIQVCCTLVRALS